MNLKWEKYRTVQKKIREKKSIRFLINKIKKIKIRKIPLVH